MKAKDDLEVMVRALQRALQDPRYKRNTIARALFQRQLIALQLGARTRSAAA